MVAVIALPVDRPKAAFGRLLPFMNDSNLKPLFKDALKG
jgi:hypothetical protein